jgi:hypothetical protein
VRAAAFLAAWLAASPALAFPDGAPWDAAEGEGCAACHFDRPPVAPSDALTLSGLPKVVRAGESYRIAVALRGADMARTGFLVAVWQGAAPAGRFEAVDGRTEGEGARARSTLVGAEPTGPGEALWSLLWHAPDRGTGPLRFLIWGNAANGDDSPLGDETHRSELTLPAE